MVETKYALQQTYFTTINGSGVGLVVVSLSLAYAHGQLTRYSVVALPLICTFTMYRGDPSSNRVLDFTQQGGGDTSSANDVESYPGDYVTGVWSGATPGASASLTVEGSYYVKGQRSY